MWPKRALDGRTSGSSSRGTSSTFSSSSSHALACTFSSSVREALLTSVACSVPPVRCHISQRVHRAEGQFAARRPRARAGTWSRSQLELGAREVGVDRPGRCFSRNSGSRPCCAELRRRVGSARRSCQTMAWWMGSPVWRFHTTRGLALVGDADRGDVAGREAGLGERLARGGELVLQISHRLVLDPAGLRVDLAELPLRHRDDAAVRASNTMLRELEVPWSRASR